MWEEGRGGLKMGERWIIWHLHRYNTILYTDYYTLLIHNYVIQIKINFLRLSIITNNTF